MQGMISHNLTRVTDESPLAFAQCGQSGQIGAMDDAYMHSAARGQVEDKPIINLESGQYGKYRPRSRSILYTCCASFYK